MIDDTLLEAEEKMERAIEHAKEEFGGIRTGRANAAMFSRIVIDYYGSPTPLPQMASIAVPEPRMVMSARVEGSDDSEVYEFAAETVRALLPIIEGQGVATAAQLDLDTLADRLREETLARGGVLVPSFLVSAWSYK